MLSCEGTGKNIEQAINNALFELKASREDVDIKIIDEGGFFKKAKVLVSISEDCIDKYERKETLKKQEQEEIKSEIKTEPKTTEAPKQKIIVATENEENEDFAEEDKQNKKLQDGETDLTKAKEFVSEILGKANITADVTSEENADEVFLNLIGASEVIGFRGEGLNALQYLANVYIGKHNRHSKKVRVDCDNYRAKREDTLIALANRMARKVAKTNHAVKLEPMTANERRIIHTALAEDKFVDTISSGEEPYRYLTIVPKSQKNSEE